MGDTIAVNKAASIKSLAVLELIAQALINTMTNASLKNIANRMNIKDNNGGFSNIERLKNLVTTQIEISGSFMSSFLSIQYTIT
ncbi:MAG: hypothetical protein HQL06_01110 [Nitrospirae bacterium]|nr:hypothetical protein [Nitrospirota bacterium]